VSLQEECDSFAAPIRVCTSHAQPTGTIDASIEIGHANELAITPSQKESSLSDRFTQDSKHVVSGANCTSAQASYKLGIGWSCNSNVQRNTGCSHF
jgi:hypothetical protein